MFDYHIEKMRQNGVIDNIQNKYKALPQECPDFRYDKEITRQRYMQSTDD